MSARLQIVDSALAEHRKSRDQLRAALSPGCLRPLLRPCLLIVEDEPVLESVYRRLAAGVGADVEVANDLNTAASKLAQGGYVGLITDSIGTPLLPTLTIPALVISGRLAPLGWVGAPWWVKPFEPQRLEDWIRGLLIVEGS